MIGSNGSSEDTGYVLGSEEVHDLLCWVLGKGSVEGRGEVNTWGEERTRKGGS